MARDTSFAVHDFCLLGADGKTKVVASSRKVIHAPLHFRFSVAVKSAQSSAKRSSLSVATFTFVFALSRMRLNTPPCVLYFSWMPSTSSSLGGLYRSVFVSTCGKRAIASVLTSAGLLMRTALKCSAHLFRMAGLSVISVVPSTLSNGYVLDDCGP